MESKSKIFAFKAAAKKGKQEKTEKWSTRDGVQANVCTDYRFPGNVRYPNSHNASDQGVYC